MKLLLCGAGTIARDLLRRLGEGWEVTLIDKSADELRLSAAVTPDVKNIHAEDASSRVVLDRADIGAFDYVLALTNEDAVNAAVAEYALERGVRHVSALVRSKETRMRLAEKDVHVVHTSSLVASHLYHHLQDPRVRVTPLNLGPASLMEIDASEHFLTVGREASCFNQRNTRLVGIFRSGRLLLPEPDTVIHAEDRLVLLGGPDIYEDVCEFMECGRPHFPLAYGPGLLVVLGEENGDRIPPLMEEGLYLAQNTRVRNVTILNPDPELNVRAHLDYWPQDMVVQINDAAATPEECLRNACSEGGFGLVVMPPPGESLLKLITGRPLVELARELDRPVLIARSTVPYRRILVPFNASGLAERALEIAVDLARQMHDVEIVPVVIEEPKFLAGEEMDGWAENVLGHTRELGHIHKIQFREIVKKGNPVKEILPLTADFDLMIIGSTSRSKGLLSPNVGESLARRAQCSVLIVAA